MQPRCGAAEFNLCPMSREHVLNGMLAVAELDAHVAQGCVTAKGDGDVAGLEDRLGAPADQQALDLHRDAPKNATLSGALGIGPFEVARGDHGLLGGHQFHRRFDDPAVEQMNRAFCEIRIPLVVRNHANGRAVAVQIAQ